MDTGTEIVFPVLGSTTVAVFVPLVRIGLVNVGAGPVVDTAGANFPGE